eukprot:COSAG01_NODE_4069_length_5383_cov_6.046556_5_plen_64_part_00
MCQVWAAMEASTPWLRLTRRNGPGLQIDWVWVVKEPTSCRDSCKFLLGTQQRKYVLLVVAARS